MVAEPPTLADTTSVGSAVAAGAPRDLTLHEVIADLATICRDLREHRWTEREDLVALDIRRKGCGDLIKAIGVRDELNRLRELAAQLERDRLERAALESGVQFTGEAPQFPDAGSGDPH